MKLLKNSQKYKEKQKTGKNWFWLQKLDKKGYFSKEKHDQAGRYNLTCRFCINFFHSVINVTSFSRISYCSNSEYWTQKGTQNGNIHSIILDVFVESWIIQIPPFLFQAMQAR